MDTIQLLSSPNVQRDERRLLRPMTLPRHDPDRCVNQMLFDEPSFAERRARGFFISLVAGFVQSACHGLSP